MKYNTIREATEAWVKEFSAIPQSLIEKAYMGDNIDSITEITPISINDRVYHYDKGERGYITDMTEDGKFIVELDNGEDLTEIINKLLSEENNTLFEEVQQEEAEFLRDEYALYEEELEAIFDKYYLDYRDRAVVGCIFKDAYDLGYEEAYSLGIIDNHMEKSGFDYGRYFDFEKFGEDLTEEESYCELPDGRIAYLCY